MYVNDHSKICITTGNVSGVLQAYPEVKSKRKAKQNTKESWVEKDCKLYCRCDDPWIKNVTTKSFVELVNINSLYSQLWVKVLK